MPQLSTKVSGQPLLAGLRTILEETHTWATNSIGRLENAYQIGHIHKR